MPNLLPLLLMPAPLVDHELHPVADEEPEVVEVAFPDVLEEPSHADHDEATLVVEVLAAGVLDVETHPPHVTGSVEVATTGVLLDHTAQLPLDELLVGTTGLLEDDEDEPSHTPHADEVVLVFAAGVLDVDVAPSQFCHVVELTEVAITGVGNPFESQLYSRHD